MLGYGLWLGLGLWSCLGLGGYGHEVRVRAKATIRIRVGKYY